MYKVIRPFISVEKLQSWLKKEAKRIIFFAIIFRLITSFLYGTQDVEWWKAWFSSIEQNGIVNVYGETDSENLKLINKGLNFDDVRQKTQNVIFFEPYKYFRKNYVVTQPPVYLYHLYIAGKVYKIFDPKLTNSRLYNFFLNFFPILYSVLTCIIIYWFLNSTKYNDLSLVTSLFYLLNPLIILNSPIQGFWDPILGFYILLSLIFLYKKKLTASFVFFAIALLIKPTAIIVIPIYLFFVIRENSLLGILKSTIVAIFLALVLISPFIFSNHFISMSLGVHSIINSSSDISRQSLNFWWPVQYYLNFYTSSTHSFVDFLIGKNFIWSEDFPVSKISAINLKYLSLCLLFIATILNMYNASKFVLNNRFYIFYFAFIQCYIYFMLRIGVQNNHYYIMLVFFSIFCFFTKELFYNFVILILIFFIQDFIFYGFGRDLSIMLKILTFLHLPFITVLLSLINFIFFLKILIKPIRI
jgi:Gpi18-like mannosyltransferase